MAGKASVSSSSSSSESSSSPSEEEKEKPGLSQVALVTLLKAIEQGGGLDNHTKENHKLSVFKIIAVANHTEDVVEGKFKAWLVDDSHVLLQSPSTNRVLREYADDWVAAQKMYGHFDHNEHEARKIGKNQVDKDSHRQSMLLLVDFGDVQLTKEHHSPGTADGILHWQFTPIPTNFSDPKLPQPLPHTATVVTWRVAATPQANLVVDQQQQNRDPYLELAAMMQQNASLGQRQFNTGFQQQQQQQAPFNQGGYQQQQGFGQGGMQQQNQLAPLQGFQPSQVHQMSYQQPPHPQAAGFQMQPPVLSPQQSQSGQSQSGQYFGNHQVLSMPQQVLSPQQQGTPVFAQQQLNPCAQPQQQQQQQQQPQQQQQQQPQQQTGANGSTSNGEGLY